MIEGISDSISSVYDYACETAQSVCSFTSRVFSAAYSGITSIGSLFSSSSQTSKTLADRVEESSSHQITLDEALSHYVNTLTLAPYVPKGSNFQIVSMTNEVCELKNDRIYFIEGKFDFEDKSVNAMFSMRVENASHVCKGFDIDYMINGPLLSARLFIDIMQGITALLPETNYFVNSNDSLIYIQTEEYEGKREQVWTFFRPEKNLSVAITLYNNKEETDFVIHDPRNQMVEETKV